MPGYPDLAKLTHKINGYTQNHQAYSCLRAFALAIPSAQKTLPPSSHPPSPRSHKCHVFRQLPRPTCSAVPTTFLTPQSQPLTSPLLFYLYTCHYLKSLCLCSLLCVSCFPSQLWVPWMQGPCLLSSLFSVSRIISNTQQVLNKY